MGVPDHRRMMHCICVRAVAGSKLQLGLTGIRDCSLLGTVGGDYGECERGVTGSKSPDPDGGLWLINAGKDGITRADLHSYIESSANRTGEMSARYPAQATEYDTCREHTNLRLSQAKQQDERQNWWRE